MTLVLLLLITAPDLKEARNVIDEELDFVRGARMLETLLEDPELPTIDRAQAYSLLAVCRAATDDATGAESAYVETLKLRPDFEPESWRSPKIKALFARAQERWRGMAPKLTVRAEADGGDVAVRGSLRDPAGLVHSVQLFTNAVRHEVALDQGRFQLRISADRLEYYATALGAGQQLLATAGSRQTPLVWSRPAPTVEVAWYEKWWVWTLVGVAVVGAATTAVVVATSQDDRSDELFEIRLP